MAKSPVFVFTRGNATVGYNDFYQSDVLNKKFAGFPKGAYIGFTPSVASPLLLLNPDPTEGYSLIKVPSNGDNGSLDIITTSVISLDFTGQPLADFPIHVLARATYEYAEDGKYNLLANLGHTHRVTLDSNGDGVSSSANGHTHTVISNVVQTAAGHIHNLALVEDGTSAEIFTRSAGAVGHDEVLICVVDGSPGALTVAYDPSLGERDAPLAYSGVDFGFMPAGSVEDLADAVAVVNEVAAARIGLDTITYDTLSERLAADQTASSMGSRLGKLLVALRSNDYVLEASTTSLNVSGSFSEVNRDQFPKVSLNGQGSESEVGAIASPNDSVRNVAVVQDIPSGYRLMDSVDHRNIIFGRVTGPAETSLSGTYVFQNAQTSVSVTDGQPTLELEEGDLLQGADGRFYEIETVFSDSLLELTDAYVGADASSANLISRRWTLELKKMLGSTEVDASVSTATSVRFIFPAFLTMAQSNFDHRMAQMMPGGRNPLPEATTTVEGRLTLAEPTAKIGSVNIQSNGTPIGAFHTINFTDGNGLVTQTGAGEVSISRIGVTGPTGPSGQSGGTGPPGPTGPGFSQINAFERTGPWSNPWNGGTVPSTNFNITVGMGHTIRNLSVQISQYQDRGVYGSADWIEITAVGGVGTTDATFDATVAGDVDAYFHVSSAGD